MINTDYEQQHRLAVQVDGLPVAGSRVTLHRMRFLTRDEAQSDDTWTRTNTETLPMNKSALELSLPSRSATIAVIPLQDPPSRKPIHEH